jgi:hypothetical protein
MTINGLGCVRQVEIVWQHVTHLLHEPRVVLATLSPCGLLGEQAMNPRLLAPCMMVAASTNKTNVNHFEMIDTLLIELPLG